MEEENLDSTGRSTGGSAWMVWEMDALGVKGLSHRRTHTSVNLTSWEVSPQIRETCLELRAPQQGV